MLKLMGAQDPTESPQQAAIQNPQRQCHARPSKPRRRRYSNEDQATALAALKSNGGNISQTARELDAPRTTVRRWAHGEAVSEITGAQGQEKEASLADLWESVTSRALGAITDDKLTESSARDLGVLSGIGTEKQQLLRGKPTSRDDGQIRVIEVLLPPDDEAPA